MCTFLLVWLVLAYFVSSKPGWFGCLPRPPGHRRPDCRMRMSASPVGIMPAGLVAFAISDNIGLSSLLLRRGIAAAYAPKLPSDLEKPLAYECLSADNPDLPQALFAPQPGGSRTLSSESDTWRRSPSSSQSPFRRPPAATCCAGLRRPSRSEAHVRCGTGRRPD